ncbi:tetratricopeptide repeat protein [Spirosoma utsteinense]|uniref:Tetratricopeptide (TPR) repeat protein n=1 Tax=Spirosoma utsteinense TaxID=2585773 RepID=A0ABR6W862_9BACT|nr:tetratricopeptide repeat protein [Spirosoma utsteinense]MBC3784141.1 tetratricopeptide (TPR) repeat protein [Spirosoma utsteinense]MBC3792770.1 tetratricopeptide (TPR) repeat protein [Spirosoma utsteinense]
MRYLLIFLLTIQVATAQDFVWTPGLQRAYTDLQKLRVQTGRQLASREPDNGVRLFVADYADMLTLVTSDNDRLFSQLADREDERLTALKHMDDNSPWQRVLQAEVRLHWAFVKLKFGKEISASWDVIRAYNLLAENQKRFPDFLPTYKSLGTLHVMIGSVPESYLWVANLLGLHGNIRQGQQELLRAQQDSTFGLEARLIDLMVRAYVLKFTDTDGQTLQRLVQGNRDNLLLHFFGATIEQKNGHSEQALTYLNTRPTGSDYQPLPIVDNILGDIYLQKGQYATAETHFKQFLHVYTGQNFLKDSHYKLFLCYWLANQPDARARPFLAQVPGIGRTTVESDKAAQKFAESYLKRGVSANQKVLMRARLASDGGFTDSALAYLRPYTEGRFTTAGEQAEYNYRLGRIHQRRDEPDKAIPYLKRALVLSEPGQLSFGATAALQLGYIYQQKNDRTKARSFFQKALSFKRHEYKNSVDNKARAGMSR